MVFLMMFFFLASRLFCWGSNEFGQLGIGSTTSKFINTPRQISSLFGLYIAQVSAGGYHSFALTTSGALFGWGRNRWADSVVGKQLVEQVLKLLRGNILLFLL